MLDEATAGLEHLQDIEGCCTLQFNLEVTFSIKH
jgi:hypothetical protein